MLFSAVSTQAVTALFRWSVPLCWIVARCGLNHFLGGLVPKHQFYYSPARRSCESSPQLLLMAAPAPLSFLSLLLIEYLTPIISPLSLKNALLSPKSTCTVDKAEKWARPTRPVCGWWNDERGPHGVRWVTEQCIS